MKKLMLMILGVAVLANASLAFADDVYATKRGKKFHTESCPFMKDREKVKLNREDAVKKGLKPCGKCIDQELSMNQKPAKSITK